MTIDEASHAKPTMPIQVLMPALSPTMEKGNLAKWLKKEGDTVKTGDVIAEIETDKATMEVEAIDDGTLGKILVPEGTNDVAVNTPIAMILGDGEDDDRAEVADEVPAPPRRRDGRAGKEGRGSRSGATRDRQAAGGAGFAGPGSAGRHRDGHHDHARSAARCHGRGNAPRSRRVRDRRGGRRISRRLQGDARAAAGVRRTARHRHADHRVWLCRARRRHRARRAKADRRIHDFQLRHAGDRSHHQFGGEDALHVRRAGRRRHGVSRTRTAPPRASPPSTARIIPPGTRTFPA